jgi:hypothetical protein
VKRTELNSVFLRFAYENIKLRLYLTLIRPILTYGAETWAATESELQKLVTFERKILRKIYGPVKDRDNWRIRTN